ncbi:hypothetical protein IDJ77_22625 [Mucilaginibacter sp. ZT4R22]|uniref:PepSY-associated transmembrane protein n=1 Tax=Mucilaginibacter pankratovii TaxID=2772110 RepID=A0ABR7WWG5_9SPHI|nr:hypothetical protein [Mucilaginibacter pankratovii]MBD1366624.1 hypothetical protein [Mucilaginibacter pankratovii]
MKTLLVVALMILMGGVAYAQTTRADSARILKAVKADLKKFKLDKRLWKDFKDRQFGVTSDHFKPVKASVSDSTLLNDSVYVRAYRAGAAKKTSKRHTTGHYFLFAGGASIIILAAAMLTAVALAFSAWN